MVRSINTLGMRTVFCWSRLKNPISFLVSIACDAISSASLKQIAFLALLTLYRRRVHCTSRNYTQWRTKETTATQRKNVLECPKWRENSTNRNTLAFSSHIFTLSCPGTTTAYVTVPVGPRITKIPIMRYLYSNKFEMTLNYAFHNQLHALLSAV